MLKKIKSLWIFVLAMALLFVGSSGFSAAKTFNEFTIEVMESYPVDGSYPYAWTSEPGYYGVSKDIYYLGELFIKGDPAKRSYCSGITFEVFMQAFNAYNQFYGLDKIHGINNLDDLENFRRMWYGADGDRTTIKHALETYGLGYEIKDLDKVKMGDFVQIWRHSGSGHTVIFVDWIKNEDGDKVGFRYWSSNYGSGISYHTEYFGDSGSKIIKEKTYFTRVTPIHKEAELSKVLIINDEYLELEKAGIFELAPGANFVLAGEEGKEILPISDLRVGEAVGTLKLDALGRVRQVVLSEEQGFEKIRVLLSHELTSWGSSKTKDFPEIDLATKGEYSVYRYQGLEKDDLFNLNGDNILFIPLNNGIGIIKDWDIYIEDDRVFVQALDSDSSSDILNIQRRGLIPNYHGSFEITHQKAEEGRGALNLINELPLTNYLYKVLPSEMPPSFGEEAYKAQAVVARSYAVSQMKGNRYGYLGAHVDDSVSFQVYNNSDNVPLAVKAVDATKGIVTSYQGEVVSANYFSTSGGYTANSEEVWHNSDTKEFPGEPVPYLRARVQIEGFPGVDPNNEEEVLEFYKKTDWDQAFDRSSSWFRWKINMSREELEATISKNLPAREGADGILKTDFVQTVEGLDVTAENFSIGTLKDIRVVKRGQGTNIMVLEIEGSNGVWRVMKEYNIRFVIRPRKDMCNTDRDIVVEMSDGNKYYNYSILPSAFAAFEINRQDGEITDVTIYGGGNGHGVGMSQWGVRGMAEMGYTYEEILQHYYTDIELKSILE